MDSNMRLRVGATAGNLTGNESLPDFPLAPMSKPMYFHVEVPSNGEMVAYVYFTDGSGEDITLFTAMLEITSGGHWYMPIFCDMPSVTKIKTSLLHDDNMGAVDVWISNSPVW